MKLVYEKTFRRVLLSTCIVLFSLFSYSATYYVSSAGNDSNSGLSEALAWKTLAKVNNFKPVGGDQILFRKGDTWEGSIVASASGASGSPIVYGSFGSGENPKIYGSTQIKGWTNHTGNIYKATYASEIKQLFVDGVKMKLARTPNTGWGIVTGTPGATSFSSTDLNGGINHAGAYFVGRTVGYKMHTANVTSSSGQTVTFATVPQNGANVGEGFILMNKLAYIDSAGEWFYDTATGILYAWMPNNDSPESHVVRGTIHNNLVNLNAKNYITVTDIDFLHAGEDGVRSTGSSTNFTLNNCKITDPVRNGIKMTDAVSNNATISNNTITGAGNNGMFIYSSNSHIHNNTISHIGMINTIGKANDDNTAAMEIIGSAPIIEYNKISHIAYNGISFAGINSIVRYNFLENTNIYYDDGAPIYTYVGYDSSKPGSSGSVISYNILINSQGAEIENGFPSSHFNGNYGIYLDGGSRAIDVKYNTIYNMGVGGILFNMYNRENRAEYNTIMGCGFGLLASQNDGVNYFTNNIVYNTNENRKCVWWNSYQRFVYSAGGFKLSMDYNTYIDHYKPKPFWNGAERNLTEWRAATSQDKNSTFDSSPLKTGETEKLFYNETKQPKTFNLGSTVYKDIQGNQVTKSITLQPFTSKILIGTSFDSAPKDTEKPVITGFVIPTTSPSLTVSFSSLSTTDNTGVTGYLITKSPTQPLATDSNWTSTKPTSYTCASAGVKTLYAWAKDDAGNVSASLSKTITVANAPVVASSFSFTGPASGHVNSALSFTVIPGNSYTGTITLTPSGAGSAGISPKVLTFSNSSTAQTFQITPTVAGSITLTPTNNGSLTNPANLTITAQAIAPGVPTSVVATAGNASASVTFAAPASDGGSAITGYTVTSNPAGGIDANAGSTTLTRTLTGLTNGSSYTFTVKAIHSTGSSLASAASNSVVPKSAVVLASTFSFTGPASGNINSASSTFTVTPNNPYTGNITLTPNGQGSAGLSSKVLNFSNSSTAQTFTITPTVAGSITFTASNNGSLTNPASLIYRVNANTENGATAYFGNQVKGNYVHTVAAGDINAIQMTSGSSFTATTMHLSIAPFKGKLKGAIYSDNGGIPGTKLGETVELTLTTTGGFQQLTGLNVPISEGTKYWLAVWGDANYQIDSETSGGIMRFKQFGPYAPWPNSINLNYQSRLKFSIYVTGGLNNPSPDPIPTEPIPSPEPIPTEPVPSPDPVATGTMGNQVKGNYAHTVAGGDINAMQMTSGSSFTATTMHLSIAPFKGKLKGAIYSDNGGIPGTKLGETVELTLTTTGGFQQLTGLNVPISQGTKYWLAIWSDANYQIDSETSGGIMRFKRFGPYAPWPNSINLNYQSRLKFSIYVTGGLKSASLGITASETIYKEDLLESVKIDVYPNPSAGNMTVRFSSMPAAGSRIDILDMAGRKVDSRIITGMTEEFNLDHQPAGIYLVKSIIDSTVTINKLIIN